MKKLLFSFLLTTGLLLPTSFTATLNSSVSKTEVSSKKQKKKEKKSKSGSKRNSSSAKSKSYSQSKGCTYNGSQLYVGKRGGCYYYSGNSKQYVDRSYCSGCK